MLTKLVRALVAWVIATVSIAVLLIGALVFIEWMHVGWRWSAVDIPKLLDIRHVSVWFQVIPPVVGVVLVWIQQQHSVYVRAVTQERALWRERLRQECSRFVQNYTKWALAPQKEAACSTAAEYALTNGVMLGSRLNPYVRYDQAARENNPLDNQITVLLDDLVEPLRRGGTAPENWSILLTDLERNAALLIKQEWDKSKAESVGEPYVSTIGDTISNSFTSSDSAKSNHCDAVAPHGTDQAMEESAGQFSIAISRAGQFAGLCSVIAAAISVTGIVLSGIAIRTHLHEIGAPHLFISSVASISGLQVLAVIGLILFVLFLYLFLIPTACSVMATLGYGHNDKIPDITWKLLIFDTVFWWLVLAAYMLNFDAASSSFIVYFLGLFVVTLFAHIAFYVFVMTQPNLLSSCG